MRPPHDAADQCHAASLEPIAVDGAAGEADDGHHITCAELELGDELKLAAKGFKEPVVVFELLGMKGRYNLSLPKRTEELRALVRDIPTHLAILDGKHVKEDDVPGTFLSLSMGEAVITSERELEKLANLRLRCTGLNGVIIPGDLYAKVIDASHGRYTIRFTSVPDEIKSYLRSILANEVT